MTLSKPDNTLDPKAVEAELAEVFDRIRLSCGDCEHPICIARVRSVTLDVLALIKSSNLALLDRIRRELPEHPIMDDSMPDMALMNRAGRHNLLEDIHGHLLSIQKEYE